MVGHPDYTCMFKVNRLVLAVSQSGATSYIINAKKKNVISQESMYHETFVIVSSRLVVLGKPNFLSPGKKYIYKLWLIFYAILKNF